MRYPADHKEASHARIVAAAAKSFRQHGLESSGIAELMADVRMTKGGFYKHFDSKDALYAEALSRALAEMADRMVAVAESAPPGGQVRAIIEAYLSEDHLRNVGEGCVLASLAPEIGRLPSAVRGLVNQAMMAYRARISAFLPGRTEAERQAQFGILYPSMAGVLSTARSLVEPTAQRQMLANARAFFISQFAPAAG